MKVVVACLFVLCLSFAQAHALTLREAVKDGYEVKTSIGSLLVLQKGKSLARCSYAADATCDLIQ